MPEFTRVTLSTELLKLRWIEPGDAAAQFAIFSDPEVMRYWSSAPWTAMEQADNAIAETLEAYRTGSFLRFGIELAATGQLIGTVGLYDFHQQNRRCNVGYALGKAHWGRGYLTEALAAVLDYGFRQLNLNRVEADIDPRNDASARVLERLSFQKEGFMRQRWIVNGEMCDTTFYGLLRSDWEQR